MPGRTVRRPHMELINKHPLSVKHVEPAEYNMGLCTGTYVVLLIEYSAVSCSHYVGRKENIHGKHIHYLSNVWTHTEIKQTF